MRVSSILVLLNVLLSVASGYNSNGFMIDTFGLSPQSQGVAAFDGTNYLVVWRDFRGGDTTADIYGARVTPEGVVLDHPAFPISTAPGEQRFLAIGFGGTNYLVAWEDWRTGSYPDLYGARVTIDGVVLDTAGIPIALAPLWQTHPAVGFDGTNFLVFWADYRNSSYSDLYCARITPEGKVLDTAGIPVSTAPYWQSLPAVAFDGTNYLVVWSDCRRDGSYPQDIYCARVRPDGKVLDPDAIPVCTLAMNQYEPAVAFDGTNYLVVWTDERRRGGPPYRDIYGARVTTEGRVIESLGIPIARSNVWQWQPSIAFDGTNYLVVWTDNITGTRHCEKIYGAVITPAGTILSRGPCVAEESSQWSPKLTRGPGNQLLLVYSGWTGTIGGKTYNTYRIWGKFTPLLGIEEERVFSANPSLRNTLFSQGTLFLPSTFSGSLYNSCGLKVKELYPGRNELKNLAPGIYFLKDTSETRKVVKVVLIR